MARRDFVVFANRGQGAIEWSSATTAGALRGQGATEYLVLLAVVLIIALVAIMLLGFFPGMATDAKITQSNAYWRGDARPFAIVEYNINSTGYGSFAVQNMEADGPFIITSFAVSNASNTSNVSFSAGEKKTVIISNLAAGTGGSVYDLNVTISYTTPIGAVSRQYGSKNIVGKYI